MEETNRKVLLIVAKHFSLDSTTLSANSELQGLSNYLDRVEITINLEETFDIELDDERMEKIVMVEDLVNYVYSLKSLES